MPVGEQDGDDDPSAAAFLLAASRLFQPKVRSKQLDPHDRATLRRVERLLAIDTTNLGPAARDRERRRRFDECLGVLKAYARICERDSSQARWWEPAMFEIEPKPGKDTSRWAMILIIVADAAQPPSGSPEREPLAESQGELLRLILSKIENPPAPDDYMNATMDLHPVWLKALMFNPKEAQRAGRRALEHAQRENRPPTCQELTFALASVELNLHCSELQDPQHHASWSRSREMTIRLGQRVLWKEVPDRALVRTTRAFEFDGREYYLRRGAFGWCVHIEDDEWFAFGEADAVVKKGHLRLLDPEHAACRRVKGLNAWPWHGKDPPDGQVTIIALNIQVEEVAGGELRRLAGIFAVREAIDDLLCRTVADSCPQRERDARWKLVDIVNKVSLDKFAATLHAAGWVPGMNAEQALQRLQS
ncbi:hypothetical protein [Nannocystis pusilla]|uniref:hypothetical protein n=1 Tax=Nannocystis pusilla TaxID=889268 RepID=UPI003B7E0654